MSRPRCFFDISINDQNAGRIVLNYIMILLQKLVKTSELYAQEKKDLDIKAAHSTESFLNL